MEVNIMPEIGTVEALARLGIETVGAYDIHDNSVHVPWEDMAPFQRHFLIALVIGALEGYSMYECYEFAQDRMIAEGVYDDAEPFFMLTPEGQRYHRVFYAVVRAGLKCSGVLA